MPPLPAKFGQDSLALRISRVVPITLWPALRVSKASDLPKPDEAPVISQVDGRAAAIVVDELCCCGEGCQETEVWSRLLKRKSSYRGGYNIDGDNGR